MSKILEYIAIPFGYLMKFCIRISPGHNYLVALIFFTLIIQVLLALIFGIKQQKNMQKQAMMAPKAAAIRKKYAGREDKATKQKMQEETMALYQEFGYSPAGGCLPLLIQLPIIMALYYVIVSPLQYMYGISSEIVTNMINAVNDMGGIFSESVASGLAEGASKSAQASSFRSAQYEIMSKIDKIDLSNKALSDVKTYFENIKGSVIPKYKIGSLDFSKIINGTDGMAWELIFIPVLIVAVMILSQILTKKFSYQDPSMQDQQNGCSMKVMMYSMPVLSAWISLSMPAAVGVYWIYRSIAATLQQFIFSKVMPLPKFTEEDYKKAEKELNGTSKKNQKKSSVPYTGEKKRSLHHIDDDDDDYPVLPEKEEKKEAEEAENAPKDTSPKGNPEDAPIMKEDKNTKYKKK